VDALKEKLALYREYIRAIILFILALSSGLVAGFYNILIKNVPMYSLWFLTFGFIILILFLYVLEILHQSILNLTKELENGDASNNSR